MSFKTRQEYEEAMSRGQAFNRLEITMDYALTIGAWLEDELKRPQTIDISGVKDPDLLKEQYWIMRGRQDMLYAFCEQIKQWRDHGRLDGSGVPLT